MREINRVMVIGAGMMGAEIAYCCAASGCQVMLKDVNQELSDAGIARISKILDKLISKGKIDTSGKGEIIDKIRATDQYDGVEDVDLVIEAVLENYDI